MADTPTDPSPAPKPRSRFLVRLTAGIGGLVAAAGSTGVAVYQTRAAPETPEIAAGAPVETGRWTVTVRSAALVGASPDGRKLPNARTALMVEADFENRTAATTNAFYRVLGLVDLPAGVDPQPSVYLKRDRVLAGALQPRLPETLQLLWTWPEGAAPPDAVRLDVTGETFKPRDNLYAMPGWFNARVVGRVALGVARPAAAP